VSPAPVVGHDDEGQVVYLGECRVHGWHGRTTCPSCLKNATSAKVTRVPKPVKHLTPLNARYRPGDEIVAFGMPRRRFWTDGPKVDREGHCRMCRRPSRVRQLTRHHLIPQEWWRQRGEDIAPLRNAAANIVPLCRPCHDEVETDVESRRMLRRVLTQTEVAFVIDVIGRAWMDERYPATGE
jgi:hypothetical protein